MLGAGREAPPQASWSLLEYWLIIKPWWRRIVVISALAAVTMFLVAKLIFTQWYQASAVIRPASQKGPVSPLAEVVGSLSLGQTLSSMVSSSTGLGASIPSDAAEFIDLSTGYNFTISLVEKHKLGPTLKKKSLIGSTLELFKRAFETVKKNSVLLGPSKERWDWYRLMQRRFEIEYDDKHGNLTLTYMDPNPLTAKQILGFYIEDIRDVLRARSVQDTASVVGSLQKELGSTSDPLLQQQLAVLLAQEIQQEKTAEAQADFAFSVTDAPYVPNEVYKPKAALLAVATGVGLSFLCFVWLMFYTLVYEPIREADARLAAYNVDGLDVTAAGNDMETRRSSGF